MKLKVSINYEIKIKEGSEERVFTQEHDCDTEDQAKDLTVLALCNEYPECRVKTITINERI